MKSFSNISKILEKSLFPKSSKSIQLPYICSFVYTRKQLFKTQQKGLYNCNRSINNKFYTLQLKNFTSINKEKDTGNNLKESNIGKEHDIDITYPANMKEEEYKLAESIRVTSACIEVFIFY